MNNKFFAFCRAYWEDIVAFFDSLYALLKAVADKVQADQADE